MTSIEPLARGRSVAHAPLVAAGALAALALGLAFPSVAAPLPPVARAEVVALLDQLATSGCRFHRNGSWHSGPDAREHLLQKLEYVEKYASVTSAEQFIDLAAAKSSISGQPYQVQCATADPVPSAAWLKRALQSIRAAQPQARPKQGQGPPAWSPDDLQMLMSTT
jgi:hypothetical protein